MSSGKDDWIKRGHAHASTILQIGEDEKQYAKNVCEKE